MPKKEELQKAHWAKCDSSGRIIVESGERPIKMKNSDGTGEPLFSLNRFGADIIRFAEGTGVDNHTHYGDHILFVIRGSGTVVFDGTEHDLYPGLSYLIPGSREHAIRAKEELILIAVGNKHHPLDSNDRMTPINDFGN